MGFITSYENMTNINTSPLILVIPKSKRVIWPSINLLQIQFSGLSSSSFSVLNNTPAA